MDPGSRLITAVEVLPGNSPDNLGALELVEQSEANSGVPVEEAMGDAAYGDGDTRQAFADAGRTLIARVPGRPNRTHFPKEDFHIDLEAGSCTCPAGNVARRTVSFGTRTGPTGRTHRLQGFRFDGAVCGVCPLRSQCVAGYRQRRVVVERRLARLVQLGIRQVTLLRPRQNQVPAVPGGHRGQPDPAGLQSRSARRYRRRFKVGSASVPGPSIPSLISSLDGSARFGH